MDEDARAVSADDADLLQQRFPLEGQHGDLAQDLSGRPPPHRGTAAGSEESDRARVWPGAGSGQAVVRPSPSRGPSGFSILEFFIPRPRHDPTSQQGQDAVLPLQLLGLAPPSAHLAER